MHKSNVLAMFATLCKAMNKKIGIQPTEIAIEYNSSYGGYLIVEYGEYGCESHPFGQKRRTANEMYDVMAFAVNALEFRLLQGE